jgi:integrase
MGRSKPCIKFFKLQFRLVLTKREQYTFHTLRHTFATRAVMAGVDIVTLKELLGHKTIQMTMRYSHPSPEHKKKAVDLVSIDTSIVNRKIDREANSSLKAVK